VFRKGVVVVVFASLRRCWKTLHGAALPPDSYGAQKQKAQAIANL